MLVSPLEDRSPVRIILDPSLHSWDCGTELLKPGAWGKLSMNFKFSSFSITSKKSENSCECCSFSETIINLRYEKYWTVNFHIHASKGSVITINQLKSFYNSPFKDSHSQPIHTCFLIIASNVYIKNKQWKLISRYDLWTLLMYFMFFCVLASTGCDLNCSVRGRVSSLRASFEHLRTLIQRCPPPKYYYFHPSTLCKTAGQKA